MSNLQSRSGSKLLSQKEWKDVDIAYGSVAPYCQYCDSKKGHHDILYTGDEESLYGYEIWFCCHPCRDKHKPCESFFKLPSPSGDV
tara:strand:- start:4062 stop:4319 length:258 start_codon:yes stop_codon:yes gene_type:complete